MVLELGGVGGNQVLRALWTTAQRVLDHRRALITVPPAFPPQGPWLGFWHLHLFGYEIFECQRFYVWYSPQRTDPHLK